MNGWMTVEEAAKRVNKSERTIWRWQQDGDIRVFEGGLIMESQLLEADKKRRQRRAYRRHAKRRRHA